jgi:hypothetical protein
VAVRLWVAVWLSLALVSAKVMLSLVPVFTIAVPAGKVVLHVVPSELVIETVFVVVPLA